MLDAPLLDIDLLRMQKCKNHSAAHGGWIGECQQMISRPIISASNYSNPELGIRDGTPFRGLTPGTSVWDNFVRRTAADVIRHSDVRTWRHIVIFAIFFL